MLRELRRTAGLSGERLARRCSMSQSKIETGRLAPALVDLDRILTALGATAEQAGLGLPSEYLDSPHPWLTAEGESWGSTSEQRRTGRRWSPADAVVPPTPRGTKTSGGYPPKLTCEDPCVEGVPLALGVGQYGGMNARSEERRVGKECRARRGTSQERTEERIG